MRSQLGCDRFDLTERYHAACLPPIPLQSHKKYHEPSMVILQKLTRHKNSPKLKIEIIQIDFQAISNFDVWLSLEQIQLPRC